MNAYATQKIDNRRPHQKLHNYKPNHLMALWDELNSLYTTNTTIANKEEFNNCYNNNEVYLMANLITSKFSAFEIDAAHYNVIQRYGSQGIYRKGRKPGAKNKPKTFKSFNEMKDNNGGTSTNTNTDELDEFFTSGEKPTENNTSDTDQNRSVKLTELEGIITDILTKALTPWDEHNKREHESFKRGIDNLGASVGYLIRKVDAIQTFRPTIIELVRPELPKLDMGLQHKCFEKLLKMCSARQRSGYALNIWVHGPAGTGKSTAAENIAKALELPFYTTGSLSAPHEVLGFNNAHTYVTTAFRQAWEHGGVYCLDEADGSSPQAMLALNGALAGSLCAFPDKIVKRHKDCVIIATANTTGQGASTEYSGRFKQDAANMDRFVMLHWPIDEALERSMCANQEWVTTVQNMRAKLATHNIKGVMITPRATLYGEALLAAGLDLADVIESVLKKSMTDAQWGLVIR
jgi:hypothetical protein